MNVLNLSHAHLGLNLECRRQRVTNWSGWEFVVAVAVSPNSISRFDIKIKLFFSGELARLCARRTSCLCLPSCQGRKSRESRGRRKRKTTSRDRREHKSQKHSPQHTTMANR